MTDSEKLVKLKEALLKEDQDFALKIFKRIEDLETTINEEELLSEDNWLQLDKGNVVAINDLDGYAQPQLLERFSYARAKKLIL